MTYEYEAFFSYKRNTQSDEWHDNLKAKIEYFLGLELGKAKIFLDREDIKTGDRWKSKILGTLKRSKSIICVWSPSYFESKYCLAEWKTFEKRDQRLRVELIVPASNHDGESFPSDAKAIQIYDFSKYHNIMPMFWKSADAVPFNDEIKKLAGDLATKIKKAPPYDDNFPIVDPDETDPIDPKPPIGRPADAI